MINEYLTSILTLFLVTFTEFAADNKARNQMGKIYNYVLILYLTINLLLIFKKLLNSLKLVYKKFKKKLNPFYGWATLKGTKISKEEI